MMKTTKLLESGRVQGTGKRRRAKLISADVWGSSAFYPSEVLARDAATAFPAGTKMFENHITESEQWERPVGDVAKLVGKLISDGVFEPDNPEGAGVYADVEFYDSYVDRINEIGEDVGLSVDGGADYVEGERDGRYGRIVTGIPFIKSVDVVVAAGAGGKLISILESAGPMAGTPIETEGDQSMTAITKEDFAEGLKALGETLTATIKESLAPVQDLAPAPAAVATATVTEPVVETPVAEPTASVAEPEATNEVDLVEVASKFAEANLPAAVMAAIVSAVKNGSTVDAAIEAQTEIREAYLAQTTGNQLRIVESDRTVGGDEVSLDDQILGIFK